MIMLFAIIDFVDCEQMAVIPPLGRVCALAGVVFFQARDQAIGHSNVDITVLEGFVGTEDVQPRAARHVIRVWGGPDSFCFVGGLCLE